MRVLGLIDSKPSAAAVVEDGQLVAAVAEERLCRWKMAQGVPRTAIDTVLELAGIEPGQLDRVAVGQWVCPWRGEPEPWSGWFEAEDSPFVRLSAGLAPLLGALPPARWAHHRLKRWLHRGRRRELPRLLARSHGIAAEVSFLDHHFCHASSAYYTCALEPALVVTLDGGGDGLSGSVWRGEEGRLRRLATVDSFHSIGNLYSYVTHLCGFRAERDEGKITGLAAHGEPRFVPLLDRLVEYREPGQLRYRVPMYHRSALERLRRELEGELGRPFDPEQDRSDLAASVQQVLEQLVGRWVAHWVGRTGLARLALAGGVFANVKLNQHLHRLDGVEELFVHPAMDDSGLAAGAALALDPPAAADRRPLPHVYLGPTIGEEGLEQTIEEAAETARRQDIELRIERPADLHRAVAEALAAGQVIARGHGAMEYGPRALGHRSILYQTTDPSVNSWLNERLRRTEFMPFAPATLREHAGECYRDFAGAEDAARFMTITFDCRAAMRRLSPGVVHVDGTARPQLVDADSHPDLHRILVEYHRLTGIPSLVNTSFNLHGEPIVCTAAEALRSFLEGGLDALALGDFFIQCKC